MQSPWFAQYPADDQFALLRRLTNYVAGLSMAVFCAGGVFGSVPVRRAPWLIAGVIVYVLSAVIQQSGVRPHERPNHNDLYHVVLAIGLYLFYRSARLLKDPTAQASLSHFETGCRRV